MTIYEDSVVILDEHGIAVKDYHLPGRSRLIAYGDIVHCEMIHLGFWSGRHQLVGIGPLRPRVFFHWDRKRSGKSQALSLDVGRRLRLAITPNDPDAVFALIRDRVAARPGGA